MSTLSFCPSSISSENHGVALKDGFGETAMVCDMPEPCKFPSLNSCQKRFLWTHKEMYLVPHPVVGLVLQVGDTEKFPHALGFEGLDPFFFSVSQRGPCFTAIEEDGGDTRLVVLELACKAEGVAKVKRAIFVWTPRTPQ